ncbi:SUN domain-containing protein 2 [Dunckerocampus dactyliophorus]|uniref:SUN domain-containing protein 2 n=1 Tax=Dunckerocampus dactyliophorus TaxID=161453 RepID=UPI0024070913|nr:SUN domain-containing protein 2 [Dunckerocampus dactyliophorus]XP_054636187.1 SUN domain-containing protein 2 [Dunckerocampus dactyliophorus]
MSRRSCRLVSTGYYNSDDESDSSSVTNISYRENPVKVFKKKAGTRKAASRTSTRANSNASATNLESPVATARRPSLSTQTDLTMRTVSYTTPRPTTRTSLTSASSPTHQTPTHSPLPHPERFRGSNQAVLYLRPDQNKSCIDSSGYSSSEGANLKPPATTTRTWTTTTTATNSSKVRSNSGSVGVAYRHRFNSALCGFKESLSAMTTRIMHLTDLASKCLLSNQTKKICIALILLVAVLACVWFLPPLLPPLTSFMFITKFPSQTTMHQTVPPPILPPQSNTMLPTSATDPACASVPSDVEAKMQLLLEKLQSKQELFYQIKAQFEVDMQSMRDELKTVKFDSGQHLDREVAALGKRIDDKEQDFHRFLSTLSTRIQDLETRNAELSQEVSSIQLLPPQVPCPDISATTSAHKHLTPELQQAMEKWLTDHIQAQDAMRPQDKGTSDLQPIANKMADFALETQGASVISTRCSDTYRTRSACVTLFGFPLWYPTESPRTVIQGYPVMLPGKCWAFHGVQGTLVIALSHPIRITHVTLDHVPHYNTPNGRIDSAPKDFAVYGMKDEAEEGTLLGTFTYNKEGEPTQTFELTDPSNVVYRAVELRVLSNWGHVEYTCIYRFRVHGVMAAT